jgi:hypothetical protein
MRSSCDDMCTIKLWLVFSLMVPQVSDIISLGRVRLAPTPMATYDTASCLRICMDR